MILFIIKEFKKNIEKINFFVKKRKQKKIFFFLSLI